MLLRALDGLLVILVAAGAAAATPLDDEILAVVATDARADRSWLGQVYSARDPGPVWFTPAGPRPAIDAALGALRAAAERGLVPEDYEIASLERDVHAASDPAAAPGAIARADVAMTVALLSFLSDLRFGRVPPQAVEPHYRAPPKDAAFVTALREAVAGDRLATAIEAVEPGFAQYARLVRLLAQYRILAAQTASAWPVLALPREKVVAGDVYAEVPALRERLVRLGDLPPDATRAIDDRYSETLAAAVRRFQERHGLEADGVLGTRTIAALNVSLATRVSQIALSLERLRWLPELRAGPVIAINIPSFELWVLAGADRAQPAALSMPIIVGRAMRTETPVFLGEMRWVEFSPYWNVPPSILRGEYLARLERDPALPAREDMEFVATRGGGGPINEIDGDTLTGLRGGALRMRQRPGPKNALGGVKFVLPNTMDIYLHGTPARALFERTRRDFSHGCIRVREPAALARFVLRDQPEWTPAAIAAAMTSGTPRTVPLSAPIPVVVFYTTAIVDRGGRAHFLADIYGHDRKLAEALRRNRGASR